MLSETQFTLKPDLAVDYLFDAHSKYEYETHIEKAVQYIKNFLDNTSFYSGASVEELRSHKRSITVNSQENITLDDALLEIKDVFLDHAISFHHPHYVAHLNCPVLLPALVGDLIASSVNTAIETWDQSTSATLIEQEIIRWICSKLNFPIQSDGVFTSGGTQSNFEALLMARDHHAFTHYGINLKEISCY